MSIKRLLLFVLMFGLCRADALSDIVGPTIPLGDAPWTAYDIAMQASVDNYYDAAIAYPPLLGSALPGTYTLECSATTCTTGNRGSVTLVGTTSPGVTAGDQIVVAWNSVDGTGAGRFYGTVASVAGNTITFTGNGFMGFLPYAIVNSSPHSGLTVYACSRCVVDVYDPGGSGVRVYSCGSWAVGTCGGTAGWGYYDPAMTLYQMYLRTSDSTYLTKFCEITDLQWLWTFQSGALDGVNPPRNYPFKSQFVRALACSHSEALAPLYDILSLNFDFNLAAYPNGQDNREPGVILNAIAMGARADSDNTRHTSYCTMLDTLAGYWLDAQRPGGWWDEKNTLYPYAMPGVSPWRLLYVTQGLARAYDVFNDTTSAGCNDTTLAASIMTSLQAAMSYVYDGGYDSVERAIYYDTEHPNNGRDYTTVAHQGACTVTVGSTAITCGAGTQLQTDFNCNGTDYIGIETSTGYSWVGLLSACPSQTSGTLSAAWGGAMQTTYDYTGALTAGSYTGITYDVGLSRTLPASASCNSSANYCVGFGASLNPSFEDRSGNYDVLWTLGWLGARTGDHAWIAKGDEIFGAAYGASADGPGGAAACAGPLCDGYDLALGTMLAGCYGSSANAPCNDYANRTGLLNAYAAGGRTLGQINGIGAADNYLAWRVSGGGSSFGGKVTFPGKVRF